jgi:DNA polymerase-1
VTIRVDLPVPFDLDSLKIKQPDHNRLRDLFIELEFHSLAKDSAVQAPIEEKPQKTVSYVTVDTLEVMEHAIKRVRKAEVIAIATETLINPDSPQLVDPLRSSLVSIAIAVGEGEAYYFPLQHRLPQGGQGELLVDAAGDRSATDAPEDRGLIRGGDEPFAETAPKKKTNNDSMSIAARMLRDNRPTSIRNLPPLDSPEMEPLRDLLADATIRKTAQNAKYDLLILRSMGVKLAGLDFDIMLASYVLDPGRRSHGLDVLALEFLDHTMTSYADLCGKGRSAISFDECPVEAARDYACEDADMALRLRRIFEPQLETHQLTRLFDGVEIPLVNVLAEMEWTGIAIDLPLFASLKQRFQAGREEVEKKIYEAAGVEFNINSNPQLREILFGKLNLPVTKRTSTGPSTDVGVLTELAEAGHELPALLMEYRELSKLENTYLDALPRLVNPKTGRLHTSFNQTVASSGRLSSNDPNLQNIPIRSELGRDIRRGFVPREGWLLLSADYSQIELRLLAHLSRDPAFVEAFQAGGDIHRQTAVVIFDVPLTGVTSVMRSRAKTINFATIYGQGARALSLQLGIDHAEAKEFIARYFERFQGVRNYLDSMVAFARENGYVQTIFGRRRYIPELRERNFNIRAFGERVAANSPIQGSAADLIKIAMIRIDDSLRTRQLQSKMLLQVHDELVFEVMPGELDQVQELVKYEMEHAAELSVPLVVDLGVGKNWLETKL